jgi:hypothetical protein
MRERLFHTGKGIPENSGATGDPGVRVFLKISFSQAFTRMSISFRQGAYDERKMTDEMPVLTHEYL